MDNEKIKIYLDGLLADKLSKSLKLDFSDVDIDMLKVAYKKLDNLIDNIYETRQADNIERVITKLLTSANVDVIHVPTIDNAQEAFNLVRVVSKELSDVLVDKFGYDVLYEEIDISNKRFDTEDELVSYIVNNYEEVTGTPKIDIYNLDMNPDNDDDYELNQSIVRGDQDKVLAFVNKTYDGDIDEDFWQELEYRLVQDFKNFRNLDEEVNNKKANENLYEKICRAYINSLNLEFVFVNDNGKIAHGYFADDNIATAVAKSGANISSKNYKKYATPILGDNQTSSDEAEVYEYDTWEQFFNDYVKDGIEEDLEDGAYIDEEGNWDFEISPEELESVGITVTDYLNENKNGSAGYSVSAYYDEKLRGLEDNITTSDWSEVAEFAHSKLMSGSVIKIVDENSGNKIIITPDEYRADFDGEFIISPEQLGSENKDTLDEEKSDFEKLSNKIFNKGRPNGMTKDSADAITASIGRKKYGKEKFQKMAQAGKKMESAPMNTNEDSINEIINDKEFMDSLNITADDVVRQVKLAKKQFDELTSMVDNYKGTFGELYDELKGWNLGDSDKEQDDDNLFDCYYKSLLVTVTVDDGKIAVQPTDVYVYPDDITDKDSDELFHLDFNKPINYSKIKSTKTEGLLNIADDLYNDFNWDTDLVDNPEETLTTYFDELYANIDNRTSSDWNTFNDAVEHIQRVVKDITGKDLKVDVTMEDDFRHSPVKKATIKISYTQEIGDYVFYVKEDFNKSVKSEAISEDFDGMEDVDTELNDIENEITRAENAGSGEDMTEVQNNVEQAVSEVENPTLEEIAGTASANSTLDVLVVDEESAIDGYKSFLNQIKDIVPNPIYEVLEKEIQEIIRDEEDHIAKLETIKASLNIEDIPLDEGRKENA